MFLKKELLQNNVKESEYLMKSNNETMNKDEITVLNILEQHAKESAEKIAERCDLSNQKVRRIIKRLDEKKIIWGYSAITDKNRKDMKHFTLLTTRSNELLDASFSKEIVIEKLDSYLPGLVQIENIYMTHGRYSGIVTFYAPDLLTAKKLVQEINKRIGKYFKEYLLLETLFPIRKQGFKNPRIKELVGYI